MMDIEAYIGHSLPVLPISEELLVAPENKPAFRERKPRDTRRGRGGKAPVRSARPAAKQHSHSPSRPTEERDYPPEKPVVKPALSPEDIKDSKFVPPPSTHSKRFGEIPAIG